jgi:hypothetical protein
MLCSAPHHQTYTHTQPQTHVHGDSNDDCIYGDGDACYDKNYPPCDERSNTIDARGCSALLTVTKHTFGHDIVHDADDDHSEGFDVAN